MRNRNAKQLLAGVMVASLIVTGTVMPTTTASAASKSVVVTTQKQLDAALKNNKITSIVIKTSKSVTLKIKDGKYNKKNLVISSPKATIKNYGDFKNVEIRDSKAVYDSGDGNKITVKDPNTLKLVAGKKATNAKIAVASKDAKISIVDNGDVKSIVVKGKSSVSIGGSTADVPTITSNAAGAKIITAIDADVILNKKTSLTVKAGATVDELVVNSDSTLNVAKGAVVKTVSVEGSATDVTMNVNGKVSGVVVDTKADINISGTTKSVTMITNNVEGASIQSSVKSEVTLNANADVILSKGAEGSSVTAGSDDVKVVVDNRTTSKVVVIDVDGKESTVSSGTVGSGTTAPTTSTKPEENKDHNNTTNPWTPPVVNRVTVTPVITVSGGVLKPGAELTVTASNSKKDESAVYDFVWKCGEKVIGGGSELIVSSECSGKQITVTATTMIDDKEVSGTASTKDVVKYLVYDRAGDVIYRDAVSVGEEATNIDKSLPATVELHSYGDIKKTFPVSWKEPDGFACDKPGVYEFVGTVNVNDKNWIWDTGTPELKAIITIVGENAIDYSVSVKTGFQNVDIDGNDTSEATNKNQQLVSVQRDGYFCVVSGSLLQLSRFRSSNAAQADADHAWVAININVGKNVKDALYYGANPDPEKMQLITENETQVATENEIILWVKLDELVEKPLTRYIKFADGDVTPIIVVFENRSIELTECLTELENEYDGGSFGDLKYAWDVLPEVLDFKGADGNTYGLDVYWDLIDGTEGYEVGTHTYKAFLCYPDLAKIDERLLPTVKLIVKKGKYPAELCVAPEIEIVSTSSITIKKVDDAVEYCVTEGAIDVVSNDAIWSKTLSYTGLKSDTVYTISARLPETEQYVAAGPFGPLHVKTQSDVIADVELPEIDQKSVVSFAAIDGSKYGASYKFYDTVTKPFSKDEAMISYPLSNDSVFESNDGYFLPFKFVVPEGVDASKITLKYLKQNEDKTYTAATDAAILKNVSFDEETRDYEVLIKFSGHTPMIIEIDLDGDAEVYKAVKYELDTSAVRCIQQVIDGSSVVSEDFPKNVDRSNGFLDYGDYTGMPYSGLGMYVRPDNDECKLKMTGYVTAEDLDKNGGVLDLFVTVSKGAIDAVNIPGVTADAETGEVIDIFFDFNNPDAHEKGFAYRDDENVYLRVPIRYADKIDGKWQLRDKIGSAVLLLADIPGCAKSAFGMIIIDVEVEAELSLSEEKLQASVLGNQDCGYLDVSEFLKYATNEEISEFGKTSDNYSVSRYAWNGDSNVSAYIEIGSDDVVASIDLDSIYDYKSVTGGAVTIIRAALADSDAEVESEVISDGVTRYTVTGKDYLCYYLIDNDDNTATLVNFYIYNNRYEEAELEVPDLGVLDDITAKVIGTYQSTTGAKWTSSGLVNTGTRVNFHHYDAGGNTYLFREKSGYTPIAVDSNLFVEPDPKKLTFLQASFGGLLAQTSMHFCSRKISLNGNEVNLLIYDNKPDNLHSGYEYLRGVKTNYGYADVFKCSSVSSDVGQIFFLNGFCFSLSDILGYDLTEEDVTEIISSLRF